MIELYDDLGFYEAPDISLPVSEVDTKQKDLSTESISNFSPYITPLQMALAAATLSSEGSRPAASLVLAVDTPNQGWVILSQDAAQKSLDSYLVNSVIDMLTVPSSFFWQVTGFGNGVDGGLSTWYVGGTTSDWQGSPLAVVVVLEDDNPDLAQEIGQGLLQATIHPE